MVLLPQILDPFGPSKAREFRHFQKTSKVRILYLDPPITEPKYSYPILYEYSIFVLFLLLEFCLSPKLFGPLKFFFYFSFLVLPNVFGPPTTVAAVVDFMELLERDNEVLESSKVL